MSDEVNDNTCTIELTERILWEDSPDERAAQMQELVEAITYQPPAEFTDEEKKSSRKWTLIPCTIPIDYFSADQAPEAVSTSSNTVAINCIRFAHHNLSPYAQEQLPHILSNISDYIDSFSDQIQTSNHEFSPINLHDYYGLELKDAFVLEAITRALVSEYIFEQIMNYCELGFWYEPLLGNRSSMIRVLQNIQNDPRLTDTHKSTLYPYILKDITARAAQENLDIHRKLAVYDSLLALGLVTEDDYFVYACSVFGINPEECKYVDSDATKRLANQIGNHLTTLGRMEDFPNLLEITESDMQNLQTARNISDRFGREEIPPGTAVALDLSKAGISSDIAIKLAAAASTAVHMVPRTTYRAGVNRTDNALVEMVGGDLPISTRVKLQALKIAIDSETELQKIAGKPELEAIVIATVDFKNIDSLKYRLEKIHNNQKLTTAHKHAILDDFHELFTKRPLESDKTNALFSQAQDFISEFREQLEA